MSGVGFDAPLFLEPPMDPSNPEQANIGIVYVLTNEAMPNLVKIGRTTDSVEKRIAELSAPSGVPLFFECHFAAEVQDAARIEKTLHQLFSECRENPKREFFRLEPEKVVLAIGIGAFKDVTPQSTPSIDKEEKKALEDAKERRPKLRLDAIGIKPGDVLLFSRDEAVTAKVVAGNKVDFEGETMALAGAALKVLGPALSTCILRLLEQAGC